MISNPGGMKHGATLFPNDSGQRLRITKSSPGSNIPRPDADELQLAVKIKQLLAGAYRKLALDSSGRLEAEILLGHALEVSRSFLYANPELEIPAARKDNFHSMIGKRSAGVPIAYLTGKREFWSLELKVTPDVLIPRPETELLVETALQRIPPTARWRIADLGTGSGAVALAIASERPVCEVHATEHDPAALSIARENAAKLGLGRVFFHQGSWASPLEGVFHVIVSNPPYVALHDPHLQQGDCRYEPEIALSPGPDALAAIREIAVAALPCLVDGGWLALEHGFDQGAEVRQLLSDLGYADISTSKDLAGLERITVASK
jgi:release factor glutamine methyltransferase